MGARTEANLGVLLFVAYRELEECAFEAVAASGADDITPAQARLMSRIDDGGSRVIDLAEQARVTKQTASFLVDGLEASGYVERTPDPRDGRARLIRLSEKGRRLVPIGQDAVEQAVAHWSHGVGTERIAELTRTLSEIRGLVEAETGAIAPRHEGGLAGARG